jgi:hypothetical protein
MLTEGDERSGHDVGERLDDVGQERKRTDRQHKLLHFKTPLPPAVM